MAAGPSPLVGYNTNVRHKGKLYHIQTEDSGVNHPHIITHLFADGGRIIASKKTEYAEHLGSQDLHAIVKQLMRAQHKAMFIDLRDCVYDEDGDEGDEAAAAAPAGRSLDVDALERAAEARLAGFPAPAARRPRYQETASAIPAQPEPKPAPGASIFDGHMLAGKSLDEVILSYLADDMEEAK